MTIHSHYDAIIIGAGVSGSFIAQELGQAGWRVLVLEAGSSFTRTSYPRAEVDGNSQLYWGGGVELNSSSTLTLLRPKVVGGGSIVNQALMDRFDDNALDSWSQVSNIKYFNSTELKPWYEKAEAELQIQEVPEKWRNGNAEIFAEGFKKNGFVCKPLNRAQRDCHFEQGNDCISCLSGCPIDSKQSTPVTTLRKALKSGVHLISEFEVDEIVHGTEARLVKGHTKAGLRISFSCKKMILAAGAIGNSKLLLKSGFKASVPQLGERFYTHPQYMVLGLYDHEINAHKGPLQSYKSADPNFRKSGFKLENVFAGPVAISMLIPRIGKKHAEVMRDIRKMACIEVAVRDTHPGRISLTKSGRPHIEKELNDEDQKRKASGMRAIEAIFESTGVKKIIPGSFGIGLHLMGGCSIGLDAQSSVVAPDFTMHNYRHITIADSSIFPDAPGINPSLTIMALSKKASAELIKAGL
jgi:choline dehydrogenase-like flavoprotein